MKLFLIQYHLDRSGTPAEEPTLPSSGNKHTSLLLEHPEAALVSYYLLIILTTPIHTFQDPCASIPGPIIRAKYR